MSDINQSFIQTEFNVRVSRMKMNTRLMKMSIARFGDCLLKLSDHLPASASDVCVNLFFSLLRLI